VNTKSFKSTGIAGCKWDKRLKRALFVVTGVGPEKKRVRRIFHFENVEEAKAAYLKFRSEMKANQNLDAPPEPKGNFSTTEPSLKTYVAEQWETLHIKCSAATQATNRKAFDSHISPFFGEMLLGTITSASGEEFLAYMKSKGMAAATTNLSLRFLRKVLSYAYRREVIARVPAFEFASERVLKLQLTDEEQARLFAAFDDEAGFRAHIASGQKQGKILTSPLFGNKPRRFGGGLREDSDAMAHYFQRFREARFLFIAAVDLGLRITDLRLLRRSSVDMQRGIVTVTTRKTGKDATIALSDRCRAALVSAMSSAVPNREYVFVTASGNPYSESVIRDYFAIAKALAGITRRCRLNDLRHTFASNLVNYGASLLEVRDGLGHASVRMAERYAKPGIQSLENMRAALNRSSSSGASATKVPPSEGSHNECS
jgi:integrase/recombinase XerD